MGIAAKDERLQVHFLQIVFVDKFLIVVCRRFSGHKAAITDVCFAPAGNLMASSCQDGNIGIWLPSITGESTLWKGHTSAVRSITFTPDGKHVLSSSDDKTIKLWTVTKSK